MAESDDEISDLTDEVFFNNAAPESPGAYSDVYKGTYQGEDVAIKVLRVVSNELSTMKRKFKREMIVSAHLKHPNIIPFYGYTEGTGRFGSIGALIFPWYPNGDAESYLLGPGLQLSMEERIDLWRGVVLGVRHLHEQDPKIIHGDLKPRNVLIDNEGRPKICDFGIANILKEGGSTGLTTTSPHTGTVRYTAPELLDDEKARPSTLSDVWALGCVGLKFIFSKEPYKNLKGSLSHKIANEIRGGVMPGFPPANSSRREQEIWNVLIHCWDMFPNERIDVYSIIASLEHKDKQDTIEVWKNATSVIRRKLVGHTHWVPSINFSPDGTHIVSGSLDKTIRLWDVTKMRTVGVPFKGHDREVGCVAFSQDGTCIASGSASGAVKIWDIETGTTLRMRHGHIKPVNCVVFSPDGTLLASASCDETVRLWDTATGREIGIPFAGHNGWVWSVAFSPGGAHIASGSQDGTIVIREVATGDALRMPLTGNQGGIYSIAFSPDGAHIASSSGDKTVRIWDIATGYIIGAPFTGHTKRVNSIAFSPDGTCIVSGSDDCTIRVWHVITGQIVRPPLTKHTGGVQCVAFSPDGTCIASGSNDHTVRIWKVGGRDDVLY